MKFNELTSARLFILLLLGRSSTSLKSSFVSSSMFGIFDVFYVQLSVSKWCQIYSIMNRPGNRNSRSMYFDSQIYAKFYSLQTILSQKFVIHRNTYPHTIQDRYYRFRKIEIDLHNVWWISHSIKNSVLKWHLHISTEFWNVPLLENANPIFDMF